jgi:hypothetical protein
MSEKLWLHFLWSFALSDHLGDASEAVRSFAEREGLPMPPDDADLDEWLDWLREKGISGGINSEEAKQP